MHIYLHFYDVEKNRQETHTHAHTFICIYSTLVNRQQTDLNKKNQVSGCKLALWCHELMFWGETLSLVKFNIRMCFKFMRDRKHSPNYIEWRVEKLSKAHTHNCPQTKRGSKFDELFRVSFLKWAIKMKMIWCVNECGERGTQTKSCLLWEGNDGGVWSNGPRWMCKHSK